MNGGSIPSPRACVDIAELYRHQRAFVRSCLTSFRVPAAQLDDALQDVFVVLFRRVHDYDERRGSLRAWLFGISVRVARKYRLKAGRRSHVPGDLAADDAVADPERYAARLQAASLADRMLETLPREQLSVVVLSEIEGLSGPEIAGALGLEIGTVYSRLHRARGRLKKEVDRRRTEAGLEATPWFAVVAANLKRHLARLSPRSSTMANAAFVSVRTLRTLGVLGVVALLCAVAAMTLGGSDDAAADERNGSADASEHTDAPTQKASPRLSRGIRGSEQDLLIHRTGSISGTISRADGGALAGATACAWLESSDVISHETRVPTCTKADGSGRYSITGLLASRYRVTGSAPQHVPGEFREEGKLPLVSLARAEARSGIDITLQGGGVKLVGQVDDVIGGSVDGATVMISSAQFGNPMASGMWGAWPPVMARSDADGQFTAWVRPGRLKLEANADGYANAQTEAVAPGLTVRLILAPESVIAGRVVDRETKKPVPGAKVTLGMPSPMSDTGTVFADEDGRFRFVGLSPGRYKPTATAEGRIGDARASLELGLGETVSDVTIETVHVPIVVGRIVSGEDETPCDLGLVALQQRGGGVMLGSFTDSEGTVVFEAVLPGTYDVLASCHERSLPGLILPLVVADKDILDAKWVMPMGTTIRGTVTNASGEPLSDAFIRAFATGAAPRSLPLAARTGADGTYVVNGVSPGAYTVQVEHETGKTEETGVEVDEDGADGIDLELKAAGSLRGRVTDEDGAGLAGVEVRLRDGAWGSTLTRDDGIFAFEGLMGLRCKVFAARDHGDESKPERVELKAGEVVEVALVLPSRDQVIDGIVLDEDGSPVRDAIVTALPDEVVGKDHAMAMKRLRRMSGFGRGKAPVLTDDEGWFRIDVGDAENFTVMAQRRGGGDAMVDGVAPGDKVTLEIEALARLGGSVQTADNSNPTGLVIVASNADSGESHQESFMFDDGAFAFDGLGPGKWTLVASASEGRTRTEVSLEAGEGKESLSLTLQGGVTVKGRVVDIETGQPVEGLVAFAAADDTDVNEFAKQAEKKFVFGVGKQRSDQDGRFEIEDVPPGAIKLMLFPDDMGKGPYGGAMFMLGTVGLGEEADLGELPVLKWAGAPDGPPDTLGLELDTAFAGKNAWCSETPKVKKLDPGGTAESAGLKVGDVVTAIDGHDVTGQRCHLAKRLALTIKGKPRTFTLGDGREVKLTP